MYSWKAGGQIDYILPWEHLTMPVIVEKVVLIVKML